NTSWRIMPNWCECDLIVTGPEARVKEFLKYAEGDDCAFDFNRLIPYPQKFRLLDEAAERWDEDPTPTRPRPKDGYNSGGYEWCVEHWGTKWNAGRVTVDEPQVEDEEWSLQLHFSTAWSPPLPVIRRASELFPELYLRLCYFESGMEFHGVYCCHADAVVRDESGPY